MQIYDHFIRPGHLSAIGDGQMSIDLNSDREIRAPMASANSGLT
jgi:hypothetical protein